MFDIEAIDHLVLRVRDLSTSIDFYQKVLGCDIVKRQEHLGLVHLRAGTSMIDLISLDGKLGRRGGAAAQTEGRNMDHLCLRIHPFDEAALIKHLRDFDIQPLGPAEVNFGAKGDGLSLYFTDPDGNVIELKESSHSL
ncbi:VOC family protein [Bowmanella denitrificans]|uniref:VOC family protein n=1 Tax=Bowmanella denitrificans TaxID=366582 RepID=A0ABP3HRE6_9ALTE